VLILVVCIAIGGLYSDKILRAQTPAPGKAVFQTKNSAQANLSKQSALKPAQASPPSSSPAAGSSSASAPSSSTKSTSAKPAASPTTPPVSPSPAPPAASDIAPASACPGESDVAAAQTTLVCMTAYARNSHEIGGVSANSQLMSAAVSKAQDIVNCDFSHTACGRPFDYWFTANGYACGNRAENIAEGQTSPLDVFSAWMNSSGHRANILNPAYTDEGIAGTNSSQGIVWVMELGGC